MKKILLFAAAAMIAFAACDKPTPGPTPGPSDEVCDDCGKNPCECPPASSDTELFLTYDLKFQLGVQTNYAGVTASLEGDKILKFFDMTEEEFFAAMGKFDFDGKSFSDNTIVFGNAYKDAGEWVYDFSAPTSSNIGYWLTAEGLPCEWADGMFFTESQCWYFRSDVPVDDEFSYDQMWDFTVGFHEGNYVDGKVGDKYSCTHFLFERETQKTCYFTFNLEVTDFVDEEAKNFDPSKRKNHSADLALTVGTPVALDALQESFQLSKFQLKEAVVAGLVKTVNFIDGVQVDPSAGGFGGVWFDAEGKRTVWGTGSEDNPETPDVNEAATPACYYIELISTATEAAAYSGYYGEDSAAQVAGKTFNNFKQEVTYTPAEGESYTCTLNYTVTF